MLIAMQGIVIMTKTIMLMTILDMTLLKIA